jgi:hypothetical protein
MRCPGPTVNRQNSTNFDRVKQPMEPGKLAKVLPLSADDNM